MTIPLEASMVRILASPGGPVVGTGFQAEAGIVLTCAHVVAGAGGIAETSPIPPEQPITLDFPLVAAGAWVTAKVVGWVEVQPDGSGDIAVLQLEGAAPKGAAVARLVTADDHRDHPFRSFGFPDGQDAGVEARGVLSGRNARHWVQMDNDAHHFRVQQGFSGGAVWDQELDGIVGIVVAEATDPQVRVGWMIPTQLLLDAWPALDQQALPPCPYRGLATFREQDAPYFFGRQDETHRLAALVARKPVVAVIGASGSGKSSLVFAGLLPQLREAGRWTIAVLRPFDHPIRALARALVPLLEPQMSELDQATEVQKFTERLPKRELAFPDLVERVLHKQGAERLLLVVDQWEELYTLCQDERERQDFLESLLSAAQTRTSQPISPVCLVLTLRDSFVGQALSALPLSEALQGEGFLVGAMRLQGLRDAITQPATRLGVSLEPGLTERLLADAGQEAGSLPLLEFALARLWPRQQHATLMHEAYQDIGGVKKALTDHAEATYGALPSEDHRRLARMLFLRLIHPGTTIQDATRRRIVQAELDLPDRTQEERMQEVVRAFITARLLVESESEHRRTLEVSHEALIREWPRLTTWLEEARLDLPLQQRLSEDVDVWEQRGKPGDRLYRGSQLKEARAWAKRNLPSDSEAAFLRASTGQRTRTRVSVMAVALLIILLAGGAAALVRQVLNPPPPNLTLVTTDQDTGKSGSLRYDLTNAPRGSTIRFDTRVRGPIRLVGAGLQIAHTLTLLGLKDRLITISSDAGYAITVGGEARVTISHLKFTSGLSNAGDLTLMNSTISSNQLQNGDGGGIYNTGLLTLTNSTVSDNVAADGRGGGIYNAGTLKLITSTVSNNRAQRNVVQAAGDGGGIFNSDTGTLTLTSSVVSDNNADEFGGGIDNNFGMLTLITSTLSGNTAGLGGGIEITGGTEVVASSTFSKNSAQQGGGIDNTGGNLTLVNSTFSGNTALGDDPALGGGAALVDEGSGEQVNIIFCTLSGDTAIVGGSEIENMPDRSGLPSSFVISNSIVAGNPTASGPSTIGSLTTEGYNLLQGVSVAIILDPDHKQSTDKLLAPSADPGIDAMLRNNPGPDGKPALTQTLVLLPGSLAIDAIPLDACNIPAPSTSQPIMADQRAMPRPDDQEQFCDIGAYETSG